VLLRRGEQAASVSLVAYGMVSAGFERRRPARTQHRLARSSARLWTKRERPYSRELRAAGLLAECELRMDANGREREGHFRRARLVPDGPTRADARRALELA